MLELLLPYYLMVSLSLKNIKLTARYDASKDAIVSEKPVWVEELSELPPKQIDNVDRYRGIETSLI